MDLISVIICSAMCFIAGMVFMSAISINRNKDLQAEKDNAEYRAVTHLRLLQKIENILRKDTINKTPAVLTVKKIKEVLVSDRKSNN